MKKEDEQRLSNPSLLPLSDGSGTPNLPIVQKSDTPSPNTQQSLRRKVTNNTSSNAALPPTNTPVNTGNVCKDNKLLALTGEDYNSENFPKEVADGRYRVLRRIGEGSFGVIFVAADRQRNNARVAIKFVQTF